MSTNVTFLKKMFNTHNDRLCIKLYAQTLKEMIA